MQDSPQAGGARASLAAAAFEHCPDSIVITRVGDGRILACNAAWERWSGFARADVLGRSTGEVGLLDPAVSTALREEVSADGYVHHRLIALQRPDGSKRFSLVSGAPLEIDGQPCVVWVGRDVTEQHVAEEAARSHTRALEQRMAERTAALEAAIGELQGFNAAVSHDLRAPLRAIGGMSAMLKEGYASLLPPDGFRLVARVEANVVRMNELIDGLLELSQLGLRALSRESVDMGELAGEAVRDALEIAPHAPAVSVAPLPPATGDRRLLRRVWANLVGNAIKYTRRAQAPRIEIGARANDAGSEYFVRDNGAGFDMQYADRLFGLFQRLHTESEFEGLGVGLALVKRIVARHGGEVGAEGAPGSGATFRFSLPA